MNLFKLPFQMLLICLLLLITTSMDAHNVIPVSDTKETITEDFDVNEFLSQMSNDDVDDMLAENSATSQIGLEWFYAKTPLQQKNILEAMKISFKAYKNCDSLVMKKEMEKSPYYLNEKQTEALCKYLSRELTHDSKMAYKLDKTENKTEVVLRPDMISLIGDYVQENSDVLNLAMTNKKNEKRILESRKRDGVDPIRYFVKTVSPQLLRYLDGTKLFEFNESKKRKLFNDVQIIFTPQQAIDSNNIESVLQEYASDLYAYIHNKIEYDPETHFALYDKYTRKMQSGCIGHQGFALKHEEGLPSGTWYTEKQCINLSYPNLMFYSKSGGRSIEECVMKCKRDSNCTACTIGSSFEFWEMVMRPSECILGPRETDHHMSVWIKDDEGRPNTKLQEYARNNKYVGRLISAYVNDKLDGYAPPTLLN